MSTRRRTGRVPRLLLAVIIAVCGAVAVLVGGAPRASADTFPIATWTASTSDTGATGVAYTYTTQVATTATLSKVTMTVPSGTGGTAAVGTVAPSRIAGGSISLTGTTLTYMFASVTVPAGLVLSIQVTGLTNTGSTGAMTTTSSTVNGTTPVDTGTATFTFSASVLTSVGWTASATVLGAVNTSCTYTFTPSSVPGALVTTFTMTVPPGTGGTPAIGNVTPLSLSNALSGDTLTVSGTAVLLGVSTPISIQINGLTNTSTAVGFAPEIVTSNVLALVDTGVAPAVTFAGALLVGAPATLTWSGTLTGGSLSLPDTVPGDEQIEVTDQTDTGAGWHATVAATTFTSDSGPTLPDNHVLEVNGSVTSATLGETPSASCLVSPGCTAPANSSSPTRS